MSSNMDYADEKQDAHLVKTTIVDYKGRPALRDKTGRWKAVPFILALEGCESAATLSVANNLVTYLINRKHFAYSDAPVVATNYLGTAYIVPLLGGFIADAYFGRYPTLLLFGIIEILGMILLCLSASVNSYQDPPLCLTPPVCPQLRGKQYSMLFAGLYLIAIGSGGLRVNLSSHGADQFDSSDPKEKMQRSSFFNWFFVSLVVGAVTASTVLMYIQDNVGFGLAYGLAAGILFIGYLFVLFGLPFYRYQVPSGSPLTRIAQVLVAALRKQNLKLPSDETDLYEVKAKHMSEVMHLAHTTHLRFLDKAAIISSQDGDPAIASSWRLCTVTQVEEAKAVIRLLPVWITTVMMNVCLAQLQTFSVVQGSTMNRHVAGSFKIPSASLVAIPLIILTVVTPLYELVFVPFVRRFTKVPTGITLLQRVGTGLLLSVVSMAAAGAVEARRTRAARDHGLVDNPLVLLGEVAIPISVFWLVPQFLVFALADMFTYIGVLEFFYNESPESMRSLGTGISQSGIALGYFLSSTLVNIVKSVTKKGSSSGGWLPTNINRSHLNYFYWLLSVLSFLNFLLFLLVSNWYKYRPKNEAHDSNDQQPTENAHKIRTPVDSKIKPLEPPPPPPTTELTKLTP